MAWIVLISKWIDRVWLGATPFKAPVYGPVLLGATPFRVSVYGPVLSLDFNFTFLQAYA